MEASDSSDSPQPAWIREVQLHLLSLSGTLAGLSITGVTLFHTMGRGFEVRTVADAVLAASALLFLPCTYFIFFALRTKRAPIAPTLVNIADSLFLLALARHLHDLHGGCSARCSTSFSLPCGDISMEWK